MSFKDDLREYQAQRHVVSQKLHDMRTFAKAHMAVVAHAFNSTQDNLFRIMGEPTLLINPAEPSITLKLGWLQRKSDGEDVEEETLGTPADRTALDALETFIKRELAARLDLDPAQIETLIDSGLFGK
jgi:hypothetical protein